MNIKQFILDNRKIVITCATLGIVLLTGIQVQAVYTVHDPKVYAQIAKQIKKATEQVAYLKQQVDMQVQNLQSLKKENIDPYTQAIGQYQSEYKKLKSDMSSIFNGSKSAVEAYKETFKDFKNIDYTKTSYSAIEGRRTTNLAELEKLNLQATEQITAKQKELDASTKRIQQLQALIPQAKGAKDLAQLQNLITAESVNSQNITSEINAIRSKQESYKTQIEKLEKDASKALNEKTASDFAETAKKMKVEDKQVTTQTGTFYKLVNGMGWR